MSLEAVGGRRSPSPGDLGRSSPIPRIRREGELGLYKADKTTRRYALTIERALNSWEISPEEWADYIAFLARLLKAIQTHPQDFPILPHSSDIANRLAQCLNPVLPSGVHQKALEVYAYIFTTFGNEYISTHLSEYLPGLSSVLTFASLSVRPGLYALLENHVVQLPPADLRSALKSIILTLLPALEEESGEDFERAFNIIKKLQSAFLNSSVYLETNRDTDGYFWQCLFLALITSPSRRQGGLNYLSRTLPPLSTQVRSTEGSANDLSAAAECVVSPEPGLLIRCFVAGLTDSQMLIQRGFLDLLVTALPLHSSVLQRRIRGDDLDRLVSAAMHILLRKDMSLNRRLWTWFLGPEPKDRPGEVQTPSTSSERSPQPTSSTNAQIRYFSAYGKPSMQRCVLKMLRHASGKPADRARPFRICLSLMDRWEIGGLLVPEIFLPAMTSLHEFSLRATPDATAEVVRSASLFFDGVEASLIWERLLSTLHMARNDEPSLKSALQLFIWVIKSFNVKDEEMLTVHVPLALAYLVSAINSDGSSQEVKMHLLGVTEHMLTLVPSRSTQTGQGTVTEETSRVVTQMTDADVQSAVLQFYEASIRSDRNSAPSISPTSAPTICCSRLSTALQNAINEHDTEVFTRSAGLLVNLLSRADRSIAGEMQDLKPALLQTLIDTSNASYLLPFPIISSLVSLSTMLGSLRVKSGTFDKTNIISLEPALTSQLWNYVSPSRPKYHVEAVRCFWQLDDLVSPTDALVVSLAGFISNASAYSDNVATGKIEAFRRFMVLWGHTISQSPSKPGINRRSSAMSSLSDVEQTSRHIHVLEQPLMLMLDLLSSPSDPAFETARNWFNNLPSLDQIFRLLFRHLAGNLAKTQLPDPRGRHKFDRDHESSLAQLSHTLGQLQNLLKHGSQWTWRCLGQVSVPSVAGMEELDGQAFLVQLCPQLLLDQQRSSRSVDDRIISISDAILSFSSTVELRRSELESVLLERLQTCINSDRSALQVRILRLLILAFKQHGATPTADQPSEPDRRPSLSVKSPTAANPRLPIVATNVSGAQDLPMQLMKCLQVGFTSPNCRYQLDQWLVFLAEVLPIFAESLLKHLLPLVECLCGELTRLHGEILQLSDGVDTIPLYAPEGAMNSLLEGLEMILGRAYETLLVELTPESGLRVNEQPASFLSNVASGVFKIEAGPSRTSKANSRLTIILAFQDTVRTALGIWLWASRLTDQSKNENTGSATTAYNALKIRNKTRHLQEQIFAVELLESLEVVMEQWCNAEQDVEASTVLSLLHVMQVTRPKSVAPAILDAMCSRTNPSALPASRLSSQTLDLSASDVAMFFSAYISSTEDDAMDEIWPDCITFLRDVLANPLPYRQVLPHLLSVIVLLAEKLNNTNFGEQRKMRRDLGDIFQRLLIATFTTLPSGYVAESHEEVLNGTSVPRRTKMGQNMSLVPVLNRVIANLDMILETPERMASAFSNVSTSLISPSFRAKSFPRNVTPDLLALLTRIARKAPTNKAWKKDIVDAFNDPKLFASRPDIMRNDWFPALHQWTLHDKERMPELLSRLTPPSSAGIMFGVGASAARQEADRRTQLNLRRTSLLLLSSPADTHVMHLKTVDEKLAELFDASPSSSPSTNVKAELFMLCRAMVLSSGPMHLAPLWPVINDKLQTALASLLPNSLNGKDFNNLSLFQACKLLDLLVALSPDEYQLHEWLYITDTIDAVYQPLGWTPTALADELAQVLRSDGGEDEMVPTTSVGSNEAGRRRLILSENLAVDKGDLKALPKEEFIKAVLRPFFGQLSIHAYEGVYSMDVPDVSALREDLLVDLLDLSTVVE